MVDTALRDYFDTNHYGIHNLKVVKLSVLAHGTMEPKPNERLVVVVVEEELSEEPWNRM